LGGGTNRATDDVVVRVISTTLADYERGSRSYFLISCPNRCAADSRHGLSRRNSTLDHGPNPNLDSNPDPNHDRTGGSIRTSNVRRVTQFVPIPCG
jgi:hypothetical protein